MIAFFSLFSESRLSMHCPGAKSYTKTRTEEKESGFYGMKFYSSNFITEGI